MPDPIASIEYTVTSRGRPIGTTTFGFARMTDRFRAGWFFPNEWGAAAMDTIAAVLPATIAANPPRRRIGDEPAIGWRDFVRSTECADLAEACHRVDALELELRCADGSIVATESIGIDDTEQLLALAADEDDRDVEWWEDEDQEERPLRFRLDVQKDDDLDADIEHDLALLDDWRREREWTPDDEDVDLPRYQIFVTLTVPGSIP